LEGQKTREPRFFTSHSERATGREGKRPSGIERPKLAGQIGAAAAVM